LPYSLSFIQFKLMIVVRSILIVLFSFHCSTSKAQSESIWHPVYDNYTVNDGLPSMEFYYSFQDKDGYMWFASDRGVVRYNGDKFETFTTEDGLVSNTVFKIDQDDQGRIWFLSDVPRLCYFKDEQFHQYKYNDVFEKSFSNRKKIFSYTAWNFDSDKVLLSTEWNGALEIDENGVLTRPDEAYSLDPKIKSVALFFKDGLILNGPRVFLRESDRFFVAGSDKIFISSLKGDSTYSFRQKIFTCEVIDEKLWIGLQGGGIEIYKIDGFHLVKTNDFFRHEHITGISKSKEGEFWITTYYSGIYKIESLDVMMLNIPEYRSNSYMSIAKRNGELFLENEVKEISAVNSSSGAPVLISNYFNSTGHRMVSDVHSDEIFVFGIGQLRTSKIGGYDHQSMSVCRKNDYLNEYGKNLFFNATGGVIKYAESNYIFWNSFEIHFTKNDSIIEYLTGKNMVELEKGNILWCGDKTRLNYLDLNTNTFHSPKNQLLRQRINGLHYSNGKLFFGTHGNGVVVKDGESIHQLSIKNGEVRKYINKIVSKDNGPVWLMGNSGISKLIHTDGIGYQTNEYNLPDLKCEKINDVYPDENYLYLATNKGIRRIKGGKGIDKKALPKLYLRATELGDSILKGSDLILNHDQNNMVVRFDAVSFEQEPVVFRYRLNKEDEWTDIEERFIRLIALEIGSYSIEIQASINGRDWTRSELLNIKILPPFWKTWWFILLEILLGIALVFFAVRQRLKFVNKQHALQQKLTDLQQEALAQQMNPHFIFNALGSVQNSILKGDSIKANKYLVKFSKLLRAGLNASRSQLIPLKDDKELMESYLSVEKTRLGETFTFDLDVQLISEEYSLFISPFLLQPIIENAIKHGIGEDHPAGNVTVSYIEEKDRIRCVILDNGKGRKAALANRLPGHVSHGSEIALERIKLFNDSKGVKGEYYVEDLYDNENAPTGTKVVFTVPIIRQ
jgi:ligand-binding sensor domain-containing protein/uncharacterized membrane-anchored protein YhcB (DUF1043 family)